MRDADYGCMYMVGTGSAVNVPLGFVPDYATVENLTDADRMDVYHRGRNMPFTSGGTKTLAKGDKIKGATSGAITRVVDVLITSGSFAAGTAAGFIILDDGDPEKTGTFTTENIYKINPATSSIDDATITVDVVNPATVITTAYLSSGDITAYNGDSSNAKGLTIGATCNEAAKLLFLQWWKSRMSPFAASV